MEQQRERERVVRIVIEEVNKSEHVTTLAVKWGVVGVGEGARCEFVGGVVGGRLSVRCSYTHTHTYTHTDMKKEMEEMSCSNRLFTRFYKLCSTLIQQFRIYAVADLFIPAAD